MSGKSPAAFAVLANSGNAIRIWWSGEERGRAERIASEDFPGLPLVELYTVDALRCVEEQRDRLLAYNQTRTDELAASVNQAAELMKQRDELLAALEAARRLIELISPFEGDVTRQIDRAIASGKAVPDEG